MFYCIVLVALLSSCAVINMKAEAFKELNRTQQTNISASFSCSLTSSVITKQPLIYNDRTATLLNNQKVIQDAKLNEERRGIEKVAFNELYRSGYFRDVVVGGTSTNSLRINYEIDKKRNQSLGGIGYVTMFALGALPVPWDKFIYTVKASVYYHGVLMFTRYWDKLGYSTLWWTPMLIIQPFIPGQAKTRDSIFASVTNSILDDIYKTGILSGGGNKQDIPSQNKMDIITSSQIPKETKARNISISGQIKSELGISNLWINNKVVPLKDDLSFEQSFPLGIG